LQIKENEKEKYYFDDLVEIAQSLNGRNIYMRKRYYNYDLEE